MHNLQKLEEFTTIDECLSAEMCVADDNKNVVHAEGKFVTARAVTALDKEDGAEKGLASVENSNSEAACVNGACVLNWRPKRAGAA